MKCPNCGAENEAGARFCEECGTPLETQLDLPENPPELEEDDSDRTIMSSFSRIAEEAKTMAVTRDQLAEAEAASTFNRGPEPDLPPEPPVIPSRGSTSGGGTQGFMTQRNIIIAVVVILVLCCCCCALGIGASMASDPASFEDLMRELSSLPLSWLLA